METNPKREAWNKGKLVGQKPPLKPKDIWAIRIQLQNNHAVPGCTPWWICASGARRARGSARRAWTWPG